VGHPQYSQPQFVSYRGHADHAEFAEGVKLIAASPDLLDPVLDGLAVGKVMDDHAVGVGRLAEWTLSCSPWPSGHARAISKKIR
jgi:hypothetical protein